jgi:erythromycin esterase
VWIDELLDSNQYQQRQDSLRNDPRVAWVRDHAVALRSIAPEDDDFSDLTGLSEYLGDARMVMLGEWGHSMGNNYSAKTRLVKFLHQQLGFDVLAVEMGLYDIGKLWRELNAGMALERALPRERVGFWITADFMPLWEYVAHWATTAHPLEVVGFDRHTTSSLATDFFVSDLRSFLADADIDADAASRDSSFWAALQQVAVAHARPFTQVPSRNEHDVFLDAVDALRAEIRAAPSGLTQAGRFWMRALKTGSRHYHVEWDFATAGPHGFKSGRSATMAENLLWLAEEYYPGRKIIVWCENNHGLRNGAHLLPSSVDYATAGEGPLSIAKLAEFRPDLSRLRDWTSVAQYVQAIMGRDFYSIGTTAYEGLAWLSAGWWFQPDQDVSIELEELFVAAGFEQAFLDVRSLSNEADWLREPIVSNVFNRYNYGAGFRGILPFVFDGVLFLRTARPSTHTDEIQVAPEVLRGYVGHYEVTPELTIAITLDSERLFAQAATGQYKIRLYAESETGFFVQGTHGLDARLTFQRDEAGAVTGLVLTQGGRDRPGRKVPSARSPGS